MVSNLTGHHQQRRVQGWCRRGAGRRPGTALGWELLITGVLIAGFQLLLDSRPTPSEQETPLMWPGGPLFPGRRELRVPGRAGGRLLHGPEAGFYSTVPSVLAAIVSGLSTPGCRGRNPALSRLAADFTSAYVITVQARWPCDARWVRQG